jgi:uncharacterized protein YndB with AHSA1/START domain
MPHYDWSKFTRKINIDAPLQAIYDAWTIPLQLERWFLREAAFKRSNGTMREKILHVNKGDHYAWLWYGQPDTVIEKGEVLQANELDKLQFSFTKGAIVTVDIGEAFGSNIVMLTQEGIPTDEAGKVKYHLDCLSGWTFYLANLKSYLEGGIDLRNKNEALANMINS